MVCERRYPVPQTAPPKRRKRRAGIAEGLGGGEEKEEDDGAALNLPRLPWRTPANGVPPRTKARRTAVQHGTWSAWWRMGEAAPLLLHRGPPFGRKGPLPSPLRLSRLYFLRIERRSTPVFRRHDCHRRQERTISPRQRYPLLQPTFPALDLLVAVVSILPSWGRETFLTLGSYQKG